MTHRSNTDVLIVGAGPVGLTLALLLARRGRTVALYERWASAYPLPRAAAMSHETVRTFQSAGVLDRLRPYLDLELEAQSAHSYTPDGEILMTMTFPGVGESGYPPMTGFHQPEVDRVLGEACDAEPLISVHRGWSATALDQHDDHVEVTFAPVTGDAPRAGDEVVARAKYVVGCDGANSTIRSLLDVEVTDTGFAESWLVVDTVPQGGFKVRIPFGTLLDPARPTLLAPSGRGRQRFEFMVIEGDDPDALVEQPAVMKLLEFWDVKPANIKLERRAIYTFRGRWADDWRSGRVLLAGDAAHQMPPFMGQGLNSGVRDSLALAWRLDQVLGGQATPAILDSYTTERLPHVKQIVESSVMIGQMVCMTDPVAAEQRNNMLRVMRENPAMAPPQPEWRLGPGIFAADDPAAGFLAQQALVEQDGKTALLDDLIGVGHFVLLGNGSDPLSDLSETARTAWRSIGGIGVTIGADGLRDVSGAYAAWFAKLGASVVLVRPDFQVFGASANITDADRLVSLLFEFLQPGGQAQ